MNKLEQTLDDLTRRVQALEDELAIHRLIVRYGFAVDIGDPERTAALFTEDTVYDVDVLVMHGRDDIRNMVVTDRTAAWSATAHTKSAPALSRSPVTAPWPPVTPACICAKDDGIDVFRVSFNRFELVRR